MLTQVYVDVSRCSVKSVYICMSKLVYECICMSSIQVVTHEIRNYALEKIVNWKLRGFWKEIPFSKIGDEFICLRGIST